MTLLEQEFNIENYISSFKHSRYGLLLAYVLSGLENYGFEFEIISGYNKYDPRQNEFKLVKIVFKGKNDVDDNMKNVMKDNWRLFSNYNIDKENLEDNTMYLLLN